MGDKDLEGLASAVEPVARRVIATQADHPRALDAEAVARVFQDLGIETTWDAEARRRHRHGAQPLDAI